MPAGTNFKLSADIGPYKQAMTEAKTATRTLDAEMKLAQTQFKATGDAETYLQQRTTILAQQIAQQEKSAQAARSALEAMRASGVEKSSKAYQDMQRAVYDAERQLVQLRQEADKTGDEVLDLSSDSEKLAKSLDNIGKTSRFTAIANGFQMVAGIARTVWNTVQSIGRTVAESADWADELITTAKQYGMSTTELQQYQYASRFVDTEVSAILKARDKLMQKTKGEGMLFLTDGMTGYGVALRDANNQARDTMDVFWDFIDVLGQLSNETERDALAQEYFGKSFRELNTLVETGRAGWEAYMTNAKVVDEDDVQKLGELDDTLEELDASWQKLKNTVIADFAPGVTQAIKDVTVAVGWIGDAVEWVFDLFSSSEEGFGGAKGGGGQAGGEGAGRAYVLNKQAELEAQAALTGAESAEATVNAFAAGTAEATEYAYGAGAALGAAFASGAASAAATFGSGWGNTTNNTTNQNFGDTYNYYNSSYAGYTEEQQRQLAGYGG